MLDLATIAKINSLPQPPDGWFDYQYAIIPDGRLAILRADRDIHAEYARWRKKSQPTNIFTRQPDYWVGTCSLSVFDGKVETTPINIPAVRNPQIGQMADGNWLIAASRAQRGDTNAAVYAPDGRRVAEFSLGDGIENVRCARDGSIWVGYFDEGIFDGPLADGSWPISSGGLVRFSGNGKPSWSFNAEDRNGHHIDDCYALSLSENVAWLCYYSGFPIVKIDNGLVKTWKNEVAGGKAMAVDGNDVLLAGGYGDDAQRIVLVRLHDDTAERVGELRCSAITRDGASLLQGHGPKLHMVSDGQWAQVAVRDAHAAVKQPPF